MSSAEILQEFVIDDSPRAPAIDPWDFTEVEAIVDSWFPDSMGVLLLTDPTMEGRMPDPDHLVQLPFSPPFLQAVEDIPADVGGANEEERFAELPSDTTGLGPSINEVVEQPSGRQKR
jgi:hypothetical protein